MSKSRPRLIYAARVQRSKRIRFFLRSLLAAVTSIGAYFALSEAKRRNLDIAPILLDIGHLVAIILSGWFIIRSVYNFIMAIIRPTEEIRLYNKGLSWKVGKTLYNYKWSKITAVKEGARGIYIFNRPVFEWGAHRFRTVDGREFKFRGHHGDPRRMMRFARPYTSHYTGIQMGRALREEKPIKLHKSLTLYPGGVEVKKKEIHWVDLNVQVQNAKIVVYQRDAGNKFKKIKSFALHALENAGGFVELSRGMIKQQRSLESQRRSYAPRRTQEMRRQVDDVLNTAPRPKP